MTFAEVNEEWHHFRHDKPGERFRNHRARMAKKSKKHAVVAVALGVLLLAGGVVLLFVPGPGLLLIVFSLALVGSHSRPISDAMDSAEPVLRENGRRLARWWRHLQPMYKVGLVGGALLLATATVNGVWTHVVAAHLL